MAMSSAAFLVVLMIMGGMLDVSKLAFTSVCETNTPISKGRGWIKIRECDGDFTIQNTSNYDSIGFEMDCQSDEFTITNIPQNVI